MKATFLWDKRSAFFTKEGREIIVEMDLYRVKGSGQGKHFPEGYRFSWIAFAQDAPTRRVLFDCHPPKGAHFHLDEDPDGTPFEWTTLDDAIDLFQAKVREHFGDLSEVPMVGPGGKRR